MTDRAKSMRRIVDLQRQMYRLCEWQMVQARAREQAVKTAKQEVLQALNDDAYLQGLFVPEMARHLSRLDVQCQRLQAEQTTLRAKAQDQARRLKSAEGLLRDAERLREDQRRKAEFAEILDQDVIRRTGASFP